MLLEIDEPIYTVPLGETIEQPSAMLGNPSSKITGHAYVKHSSRLIRQNVDPERFRFEHHTLTEST